MPRWKPLHRSTRRSDQPIFSRESRHSTVLDVVCYLKHKVLAPATGVQCSPNTDFRDVMSRHIRRRLSFLLLDNVNGGDNLGLVSAQRDRFCANTLLIVNVFLIKLPCRALSPMLKSASVVYRDQTLSRQKAGCTLVCDGPCGCSSMAELLVPNQVTRVRFPSPAPDK